MENNNQKWYEKPVTWGGYCKLAAVAYAISLVISGVYCLAFWQPSWWTSFTNTIGEKLESIEGAIRERF